MNTSAAVSTTTPINWLRLAPGLLVLAAVLLLFRDTAVAMVTIWIRSETFAHAFLVPPIVLWMVWRRRAVLATITPRPAPWVLLPMAAVCALWLLGELASVNAATQLALVTLLVLSVPLVYGLQVAHALLFPLLFLFFAVPVGEFMVPPMMEWTADFTVAALRFSGVPVLREGLQFVIPTGSWSVVEACSGVRYLIASFMVGTLFAYLNYRSPKRRAAFMLVSLAVPILANWLRAYLIVIVGHLSGNKIAAGVDHIIYGWVFFGIVIGLMFTIGARFAEPDEPAPAAAASTGAAAAGGPPVAAPLRAWMAGVAALVLLAATQASLWRLDRPHEGPPLQLALPEQAAGGWTAAPAPLSNWTPFYGHAVADVSRTYAQGAEQVGLWVAYYRDQSYERKLVTSTNSLVEPVSSSPWQQVEAGGTVARAGSGAGGVPMRTATLRGSVQPGSTTAQRLRVWHLYWVGGTWIAGDAKARLQVAFNRVLGRGDDGAAVFFYADAADPAAADAALSRFVAANLEPLAARLDAARAGR